jgi:hypothetical protein
MNMYREKIEIEGERRLYSYQFDRQAELMRLIQAEDLLGLKAALTQDAGFDLPGAALFADRHGCGAAAQLIREQTVRND